MNYIGGLLGESERKNLSQMANNAVGVTYHRLHHFLTETMRGIFHRMHLIIERATCSDSLFFWQSLKDQWIYYVRNCIRCWHWDIGWVEHATLGRVEFICLSPLSALRRLPFVRVYSSAIPMTGGCGIRVWGGSKGKRCCDNWGLTPTKQRSQLGLPASPVHLFDKISPFLLW